MNTKLFPEILEELAGKSGHDEMTLDKDGNCTIQFDSDVMVNFHYDEDAEEVLAFAIVTTLDDAPDTETLLIDMMRANYLWIETKGFTLSLAPKEGIVTLADKRPGDFFTSADMLATYLDAMLGVLYAWRMKIDAKFSDEMKAQLGDKYDENAGGDDDMDAPEEN